MRVEDLRLPKLLEHFRNERIPDEAGTTVGLAPLYIPSDVWTTFDVFLTLARTGRLFVVNHSDATGSWRSIPKLADQSVVLPELPPLPFPRMIFEMGNVDFGSIPFKDDAADDVTTLALDMICLNEHDQGVRWDVAVVVRFWVSVDDEQPGHHALLRGLTFVAGHGLMAVEGNDGFSWHDLEQDQSVHVPDEGAVVNLLAHSIVDLVHLANARGVRVVEQQLSRQVKRRAERYRYVHPQTYFVYVGGEEDYEPHSRSDREYHVRWLVRGHWRHFDDGSKTWVRPYIKGPAGAPWKGDPVHVLESGIMSE